MGEITLKLSHPDRVVVDWRAVGVDDDLDAGPYMPEAGQWRASLEDAQADAEDMRNSSVPYADVYVEKRTARVTIQRMPNATASSRGTEREINERAGLPNVDDL